MERVKCDHSGMRKKGQENSTFKNRFTGEKRMYVYV